MRRAAPGAHANAGAHRRSDNQPRSTSHGQPYADIYPNAEAHRRGHPHADIYRYTRAHRHARADIDRYTVADTCRYADAYRHWYADIYRNPGIHRDPNRTADLHPCRCHGGGQRGHN
jgi:hypothetical protein